MADLLEGLWETAVWYFRDLFCRGIIGLVLLLRPHRTDRDD
jgi:hypothetical protein